MSLSSTSYSMAYYDDEFLTDLQEACFLYAILPYITAGNHNSFHFAWALAQYLVGYASLWKPELQHENHEFINERLEEYKASPTRTHDDIMKTLPTNVCHVVSGRFKYPPPTGERIGNYYYLREIASSPQRFAAITALSQPQLPDSFGQNLTSDYSEITADKLISKRITYLIQKMFAHKGSGYTNVEIFQGNMILLNERERIAENGPWHHPAWFPLMAFTGLVGVNVLAFPIMTALIAASSALSFWPIAGIIFASTIVYGVFIAPRLFKAVDPDFDQRQDLYFAQRKLENITGIITDRAHTFDDFYRRTQKERDIQTRPILHQYKVAYVNDKLALMTEAPVSKHAPALT